MTPEQIDAVTNAAINAHSFLDQHGPYLFAAATGAAGWWAIPRISRITQRRKARRGIQRLESYANHPANRSPRKEKP
ncbi:MAG: hypothetical protein HOZ81_04970 [Streptomyces sp.]|nr:hypothetical protein [Streptomyces sp.]